MALFEKREEVFCKRDREGWTAAKAALKAAGVRGMRAWHFEDEPPVGGCGCKLGIRNFGPKGRIDREMYVVTVPAAELERAAAALASLEARV